jgi:hypothetical protein
MYILLYYSVFAAYLASKTAVALSPKTVRPEVSQPLAPPTIKLSIEGNSQNGFFPPDSEGTTPIFYSLEN